MKYIQSFYQYPITFSSIGKTLPCRDAIGEMRNIAEFSDKEIGRLQSEPLFRELLRKKKIRILNHLPQSYVPPAKQINDARAEVDELKAKNDALLARIAELEKKTKADGSKEEENSEKKADKSRSKKKE